MAKLGKGMLSSVEQAFVGRDEKRAPLKTPAWEANNLYAHYRPFHPLLVFIDTIYTDLLPLFLDKVRSVMSFIMR